MNGIPFSVIWFVLFIIFVVAEIATAASLVSIWLCFGALAAMFAAIGGAQIVTQAVIFIAVSVVLLILTKPFVNKVMHNKIEATNAPAVIGSHGIVTENINNIESTGAVKADGKIWTARTVTDEEKILEGTKVEILEIRGVKLIVKALDKE